MKQSQLNFGSKAKNNDPKASQQKGAQQAKLSFGNAGQLGIKKVVQEQVILPTDEKLNDTKIMVTAQQEPTQAIQKVEEVASIKQTLPKTSQEDDVKENITTNSRKRRVCTVDDDCEEDIPVIKSSAKKQRLNDGTSASVSLVPPPQKLNTDHKSPAKIENKASPQVKSQEESKQIEQNFPPKDLSSLRAPSSLSYNPIEDAPFHKGQAVPFGFIARALSEIEICKGKNSKDAIKEIVANIFRSTMLLSPHETADLFYFFCVKLGPDYDSPETGIGLELLSNAVAKACGKSLKQIREQFKQDGDYGIVVEKGKGVQKSLGTFFKKQDEAKKAPLTFRTVFQAFLKIGRTSGNNSQTEKEQIILKLLQDATNEEAKYIVRWLQKNLKTGAAEKTFISALARAIVYTPPNSKGKVLNSKKILGEAQFAEKCAQIEMGIGEAICEFPNYGLIIETLLEVGDDMVKLKEKCHITVGIPVKPMLAKPTKGIREVLDRFEQVKFTCEYKYDGFRGQIHFNRNDPINKVKIYSRNLEDMTGQYPDIVDFVTQSPNEGVDNYILDSELVAFDHVNNRILPFQTLTQRSRKNVTEEDLKTRICICAFDLLYLNGQSLLKEPFIKRREILHQNLHEVQNSFVFAKFKDAEAIEAIEEFLADSIKDSCEGLMIKTLDTNATYEPSKRSLNWLKLKKDYIDTGLGDSLDLVVVGADFGKGKRTGMYGSFLLACYDENLEVLQTVTKMATGLSDEMLAKIYEQLKDLEINKPPSNLKYKEKNVDVWIMPKYVWEIKCADLSISPVYCASIGSVEPNRGIALRFPRFIRERDDKQVEDATSSEQILEYYKSQPSLLKNDDDDEFDF